MRCPILSRRILRPVEESIKKQKQFITNAGHELKTPLAIISANADVIDITYGGNEWLSSIKGQTKRLNELVKNLLQLAKFDEKNVSEKDKSDFCISNTVLSCTNSFLALADAKEISLEHTIEDNMSFFGNEGEIYQSIAILLDNAIKYSPDEGVVKVNLQTSGKRIVLEVFNTLNGELECNLDQLFDRYYRSDKSRSRDSGGYGIGLSLAKCIFESYKGSIHAYYKDEGICFQVEL